MLDNLSNKTIEFIANGYEGLNISLCDFFTKDILIKTNMVIDGSYPSWGGFPDSGDKAEIKRLIKECK